MNIALIAAAMSSAALRYVRRVLEAEMLEAVEQGVTMTQSHVGKLEMLSAIGMELYKRGALLPPPSSFDTCMEDGVRYSMQVRVF